MQTLCARAARNVQPNRIDHVANPHVRCAAQQPADGRIDHSLLGYRQLSSVNKVGFGMIGWSISVGRLRSYERECRHQAAAAEDVATRDELTKLGETFRRAIQEHQAAIDELLLPN